MENSKSYFEHFKEFWLPIYRYQVTEAKLKDNKLALSEIMMNIVKNIHLDKTEKEWIVKEIGIYYLYDDKKNVGEEMFKRNKNLIYFVLKKMNLLDKCDELYDVGLIGLTKAINTFDSSKGYKESSYFTKCIFNEINIYFQFQNTSKRKCTGTIISLDKVINNDSLKERTISDFIADDSINIEQELLIQEQNQCLYEAIKELKPDWQYIIKKRYGINTEKMKLSEIASELGISKQAIQAKEKKALKKLKSILQETMKE